jgi:hypothetical protein
MSTLTRTCSESEDQRFKEELNTVSIANSVKGQLPAFGETWGTLGFLLPIDCPPERKYDWALIEIGNHDFGSQNSIEWEDEGVSKFLYPLKFVEETPCDNAVLIISGLDGVVKGIVSGTPSYMLSPYGGRYEEVWTVRLEQRLGKMRNLYHQTIALAKTV